MIALVFIDIGPVGECRGAFRVAVDDLGSVCERLLVVALHVVGIGPAAVGRGEFRVEPNGLAEIRDRFVELALLAVGKTAVVVGLGIFGIATDRGGLIGNVLVQVPLWRTGARPPLYSSHIARFRSSTRVSGRPINPRPFSKVRAMSWNSPRFASGWVAGARNEASIRHASPCLTKCTSPAFSMPGKRRHTALSPWTSTAICRRRSSSIKGTVKFQRRLSIFRSSNFAQASPP